MSSGHCASRGERARSRALESIGPRLSSASPMASSAPMRSWSHTCMKRRQGERR